MTILAGFSSHTNKSAYLDEWTPGDGDAVINLGDAAGANKVIIKDSGGVEVATIDSDGVGTFASLGVSGESAVPSTPAAGAGGVFYTKADGKPYWKSDDVAEAALTDTVGVTADLDFDGYYALNEQGRTDHVSNTMPSPYYRFDGVNDKITITDNAIFEIGAGDFSFSVDVYVDVAASNGILEHYTAAGDRLTIYTDGGGLINGLVKVGAVNQIWVETTVALEIGKWINIAWVCDRDVGNYIYVNGIVQALDNDDKDDGVNDLDFGNTTIGYSQGAAVYFGGEMSRVRQFNNALTAAEVKALYAGGSVPFKYQGASQTATVSSDFSAGVDGWSESRMTQAGNIDGVSDGGTSKDNTLRNTLDSGSGSHSATVVAFSPRKRYRVQISVYIPSGNTAVDGFKVIQGNSSSDPEIYDGTSSGNLWVDVDTEFTADNDATNNQIRIFAYDGASVIIDQDGDLLYIHNVIVTQIGAVAEYDGSSMGHNQWQDKSGNALHGTVTGASLENAGLPHSELYEKLAVTGETTLTDIQPAGYEIASIAIKETAGNTITNLDIGYSDGGGEIVAAANITGSDTSSPTLLQKVDNLTATDTIYISAGTWNAGSVDIYFVFRRLK